RHDDESKIYMSDRITLMPRKMSSLITSQTEPRSLNFVNTINIIMKVLDQTIFSVQARNIIIREFNGQELRLDPSPNVRDLVHKEEYLYS
ncbi:3696_t:CDS:2, partial [Funneliformis caledonium]